MRVEGDSVEAKWTKIETGGIANDATSVVTINGHWEPSSGCELTSFEYVPACITALALICLLGVFKGGNEAVATPVDTLAGSVNLCIWPEVTW